MKRLMLQAFGVIWLATLCMAGAQASYRHMVCDAVYSLSEISLPSSLIPLVVADTTARTCSFYISLPPQAASAAPAEHAAQTWLTLLENRLDPDKLSTLMKEGEFGSNVVNSMIDALKAERFKTETGSLLSDFIRNYAFKIEACTIDSLVKSIKFDSIDEVLSCGIDDEGNFVVRASYGELSETMYFPT